MCDIEQNAAQGAGENTGASGRKSMQSLKESNKTLVERLPS
jgi:hypothetical protein